MAPKRRLSFGGRKGREMEKGKWLDDFLKRRAAARGRRKERERSETMSRIAVTGQFSSAVSFSVFFSLSLPLLII